MKDAILESILVLAFSFIFGAGLFLIECSPWLQWSFWAMMVSPCLWFIPQRIAYELKNK
jgi:hypothetical protein